MTEFHIRIDDGPVQVFNARTGIYSQAVMEAFGVLGLPYPCSVEIWVPHLVEAGYGPYFYRIADFVDMAGNVYGCPSVMVMVNSQRPSLAFR
ncbi:MAG: hypothetical protein EOS20_05020 [Mesorhizobium sp.]|uniref:hypothetical protein n=1 Tax=Mesorhizobium sp. TaxID=1871066 RepID=UPI000FE4638B|nr:hypothetical protein [Mesorhizobium sp.]RWQ32821.1 MAG: hypothetical protein EOS21_30705 [Mesorhizobium sp.]RWQ39503.1 MAG: hypothetical protein EOS20_05020 [Mesorhizobium sp.]